MSKKEGLRGRDSRDGERERMRRRERGKEGGREREHLKTSVRETHPPSPGVWVPWCDGTKIKKTKHYCSIKGEKTCFLFI
jgi:hypothetical protein